MSINLDKYIECKSEGATNNSNLYAITLHQGLTINSGHYTSRINIVYTFIFKLTFTLATRSMQKLC